MPLDIKMIKAQPIGSLEPVPWNGYGITSMILPSTEESSRKRKRTLEIEKEKEKESKRERKKKRESNPRQIKTYGMAAFVVPVGFRKLDEPIAFVIHDSTKVCQIREVQHLFFQGTPSLESSLKMELGGRLTVVHFHDATDASEEELRVCRELHSFALKVVVGMKDGTNFRYLENKINLRDFEMARVLKIEKTFEFK